MNQSDWPEIERILAAALELAEDQRAARVEQLCAGNSDLRSEVISLLAAHAGASSFLNVKTQISSDSAASFSLVNKQLGPYRLLELIGRGGMGTVYRAERTDGQFQKQVAIKVVPAAIHSPELQRRFSGEQHILASLEHPNIARLYDAGISPDGVPYFVMEYVDGMPISQYCDARHLGTRERLELFQTVCESVLYAHQHLVVHRDLKPANILVSADGVPKLLDFGVAKILDPWRAGLVAATHSVLNPMTPGYASPEQARGEKLTTASDIYSLGVVLYELLTGQPAQPISGKSLDEAIRIITETDPQKPSTVVRRKTGGHGPTHSLALTPDLDAIVAKAMRKDPQERYASALEFSGDLSRYLDGLPVLAHRGTVRYRATKFARRHRLGVALAAAALAVLLGFAVTMTVQARRISMERDRTNREAEISKRVAEFMTRIFRISNPSERVGSSVTAREILDKAAKDIETGLSKDPELQSRMMYEMGMAYLNLGLYSRAEELLGRSVQIASAAGGAEKRETMKTRQRLAWTLYQEGRFAEAEAEQRKLLEFEQRVLGSEDPETVGVRGDLATTLSEEGDLAEAEQLQREVLEWQKRALGPEANYTLVSMNNLASILDHEKRFAEADKLERECLGIKLRVAGPENLATIHYMLTEAGIQADMGELDESEKSLRQLLELEHRVLGPNQPEIAVTLYQLGAVAAKRGQIEEALSILQQAIDTGLLPRVAVQMAEDPDLHALHGNPHFAVLVAKAKEHASGGSSVRPGNPATTAVAAVGSGTPK